MPMQGVIPDLVYPPACGQRTQADRQRRGVEAVKRTVEHGHQRWAVIPPAERLVRADAHRACRTCEMFGSRGGSCPGVVSRASRPPVCWPDGGAWFDAIAAGVERGIVRWATFTALVKRLLAEDAEAARRAG